MKNNLSLKSALFLCDKDSRLPLERIKLLRALEQTGSISKAAKECGLSYKAAWDALHSMQNLLGISLFVTDIGGKGGGGSRLSQKAKDLLHQWEKLISSHDKILELLEREMGQNQDFSRLNHLVLQTSARNQLAGKIKAIHNRGLVAEVEIELASGPIVTAQITCDSLMSMGLNINSSILCLIKASSISLSKEATETKSNQISGQIVLIDHDDMQAEIQIQCHTSLLLVASIKKNDPLYPDLKMSDTVFASFLPSSVILATISA
ncbi:MAG: TOBE domain-containing protein [Candidatus Cloacimonetes bacterium]|nr:TOBE domain-containing protein [Candidatus Cloacimonadota bacterium]